MAYWRLFYHFVWTTKERESYITPDIEPDLYRYMHSQAKEMYVPFFVIGGIEDHVHILATVRPAVSPADFMQQLKGSSSHFITHVFKRPFEWQDGYGVFSVSEQDTPRVIAYIKNQKQHHAQGNLVDGWEQTHHWDIGPEPEEQIG